MSNYGPYDIQTDDAAADLSDQEGRGIALGATGANVVGNGAAIDGVLTEGATAGGTIGYLATPGRKFPARSGAAFARGADLGMDANSNFVAAASGDVIVAKALEAATGADQLVTALLTLRGETVA